jgi:transcriptional regulator with XRE-family HTH domain
MTTTTIERRSLSASVADEIRANMGRKRVTQRQLAERLGVSHLWISRRIGVSASVDLTLEEIAKMAEALNVSVESLVRYAITDSNREPADYTPFVNETLTVRRITRQDWGLAA